MSASRLGLEVYPGTTVVSHVVPGGSAAAAGIVAGHRIEAVANVPVATEADVLAVLALLSSGTVVLVQSNRAGRSFQAQVQVVGTGGPSSPPLGPPVGAVPASIPAPTSARGKPRRGLVIGLIVAAVVLLVAGVAFLLLRNLATIAGHSESYKAGSSAGTTYRQALSPSDFDLAIGLAGPDLTCQGMLTAWLIEHGDVPGGDQKQWVEGCKAALD